jgi:hypothetical protein
MGYKIWSHTTDWEEGLEENFGSNGQKATGTRRKLHDEIPNLYFLI